MHDGKKRTGANMTRREGKRFAFLKRQSYVQTAGTLLERIASDSELLPGLRGEDGWSCRMSGLRFESMADMPPRMREAYAKQVLPDTQAQQAAAKYHNAPAERAGVRFDSQKEARRYDELMVMLRAGIISDLRLQPQFTLQESYVTETGERIRAVRYTADFSYKFGGKLVVEDVKSKPTRTKEYLRNRKFMRSRFGIDVQEV